MDDFHEQKIHNEKEKLKELFDLSLYVLKEEQERFKRIDEKASKYFTIITVLLGIYGFFGKWIIENIKPPYSSIDKLFILLSIISLFLICKNWYVIFNVLRTKTLKKIPMNEEMIEFFQKNEINKIYIKLAESNGKALNENIRRTEHKADLLDSAHKWIIIAGYSLIINFIVFILVNINK
jgi:hypothetical protein